MKTISLCSILAFSVMAAGCETLAVPVIGAGVNKAVKEEKESEVSDTFTQPLQKTRGAVLVALKRMGMEVTSTSDIEKGQKIAAKAKDQPVEVQLTSVTQKSTKMSVKVGETMKRDKATAEELVQQTQRVLKAK